MTMDRLAHFLSMRVSAPVEDLRSPYTRMRHRHILDVGFVV